MGFHIPEYDTQYKQYLNLSASASLVIEEDERIFSNAQKENWAGFLNKVFSNFYQDAQATISQRVLCKEEELRAQFSSKEFRAMDNKLILICEGALL